MQLVSIERVCLLPFFRLLALSAATAIATTSPIEAVAADVTVSPSTPEPSALSQPHPYGVHDMVRMQRVGDPRPSPDGQWAVFTVRSWDPEANKSTTNLWLVSLDGEKLRQLTSAKGYADTSPVWSPDSRTIAFVSSRGGSRQIW